MNFNDAIGKVRKLRAHAAGTDNIVECNTYLRMARVLVGRHDITEVDIKRHAHAEKLRAEWESFTGVRI